MSAFADFFNGDPPFEAAFTLIFFPVAEVVARAFDVLALVAGFEGATGTGCNDFDTVPDFPTLDLFFFDIRVAPIIAKKNSKNKMTRTKVVVE